MDEGYPLTYITQRPEPYSYRTMRSQIVGVSLLTVAEMCAALTSSLEGVQMHSAALLAHPFHQKLAARSSGLSNGLFPAKVARALSRSLLSEALNLFH